MRRQAVVAVPAIWPTIAGPDRSVVEPIRQGGWSTSAARVGGAIVGAAAATSLATLASVTVRFRFRDLGAERPLGDTIGLQAIECPAQSPLEREPRIAATQRLGRLRRLGLMRRVDLAARERA